MPRGTRSGFLAMCSVFIAVLSAQAENRTFTDLLNQAKAQAAAGHQWTPPGNNMTETVMKMMDLIPTATPSEIAELSALLENTKSNSPNLDAEPERQPDQAASVPTPPPSVPPIPVPSASVQPAPIPPILVPPISTPPATEPPRAVASNTPNSNPKSVDRSETSSDASNQMGPSQIGRSQTSPGRIAPNPNQMGPAKGSPAPDSRAAVLFARGLDAELRGDFSAARRFYSSAAQQGDAAAARNLGRLYDPAYLKETALGGVDPNPAVARQWYERAITLGDAEAGPLLEALSVR